MPKFADHLLRWAFAVALSLISSLPATAAAPTEAQGLAMKALELEFNIYSQTGNDTEIRDAFKAACDAGYNLACLRGAWVVYGQANLQAAADLFGTSCDSGDPVACMVVGWHLDRSAPQSSDRDKQWRSAAKLFRGLCDDGFGPGCYDYGWAIYLNKGFKADPRAALGRWKTACDGGDAPSCWALGKLNAEGGTGIPTNRTAAVQYLTKACNGGLAAACFDKGSIEGAKWTADEKDAFYGAQCDAGHMESCWTLAQVYLSGSAPAPTKDRVDGLLARGCQVGSGAACFEAGRRELAEESPDFAAASTHFSNACALGEMSGCTSQVELITAGKVDGSVKTAPEAFETACLKRNSEVACTELALELMRGVDLPRDPGRARALLHRACVDSNSSPRACSELGRAYEEGAGGERDRTTAAQFYRWACDAGHTKSCEARGDLLLSGRGITRDDTDALAMFTKACDAGAASACYKGGKIVDEGTYVKRDPQRATSLYRKACEAGDGTGCFGLGKMLEQGGEGTPDPVGARAAYERGIALGSVDALREQARVLWNGIGGKKQHGRARRLAAEACQKGDAVACAGAEGL